MISPAGGKEPPFRRRAVTFAAVLDSLLWTRGELPWRAARGCWRGPHRIKQYLGPHLRTVGGRALDIDSLWVYAAAYR
jgi:hypothetical protein